MIVNDSDPEVKQRIVASKPDNVDLMDYVPYDQLPHEFGRARMLLSTGDADYEGFPTVLLHAVAAEKPIVSLHDFDQFIRMSSAGRVCGDDLAAAANAVREFWSDPSLFDPTAAIRYLSENHTVESVTRTVVETIRRLTETPEDHSSR